MEYFISDYEKQYMDHLSNIYHNGFSDGDNERTGIATKRLPGIVIRVDVEKEFPILKSKFVAAKTAQREIEWIWKQQSNRICDLKASIWDEWRDENGTIGKAYGYQIRKPVRTKINGVIREYPSQAHYVIEYLREFPNGRQATVTLWSPTELSEMQLVPCCHTSTWNLDGGRLNCVLDQRSGDMPYGVPFNTTQYAELMIMIAAALGVKPGILTHVIADAHIYANQMEGVSRQLANYEAMKLYKDCDWSILLSSFKEKYGISDELLEKVLSCRPKFVIDDSANVADFFSYDADSCRVENYEHMGKIDFGDVAV